MDDERVLFSLLAFGSLLHPPYRAANHEVQKRFPKARDSRRSQDVLEFERTPVGLLQCIPLIQRDFFKGKRSRGCRIVALSKEKVPAHIPFIGRKEDSEG